MTDIRERPCYDEDARKPGETVRGGGGIGRVQEASKHTIALLRRCSKRFVD